MIYAEINKFVTIMESIRNKITPEEYNEIKQQVELLIEVIIEDFRKKVNKESN